MQFYLTPFSYQSCENNNHASLIHIRLVCMCLFAFTKDVCNAVFVIVIIVVVINIIPSFNSLSSSSLIFNSNVRRGGDAPLCYPLYLR